MLYTKKRAAKPVKTRATFPAVPPATVLYDHICESVSDVAQWKF
jgi:hypothetical protein